MPRMPRINEGLQQRDRENARLKPTGRTFYARTPTTAFHRREVAGHHPEFRSIYLNDETGVTASFYANEVEFASWLDEDAKKAADEFQAAFPGTYEQPDVVAFLVARKFVGFQKAPGFTANG